MRVLVIEDNPVAGSALTDFLRHRGHTTEWAVSMREAEIKANVFRPDALVLDLGLEAGVPPQTILDRARLLPGNQHIMILTALPEDQVPPLRSSTMLAKPVDPQVIVDKLEQKTKPDR